MFNIIKMSTHNIRRPLLYEKYERYLIVCMAATCAYYLAGNSDMLMGGVYIQRVDPYVSWQV